MENGYSMDTKRDSEMSLSQFVLLLILRHPYNPHITKEYVILSDDGLIFYMILFKIWSVQDEQILVCFPYQLVYHLNFHKEISWYGLHINTDVEDMALYKYRDAFYISRFLCTWGEWTYMHTSLSSVIVVYYETV